jgi:uncharacterized protein with FMN-binding domain
MKKTIVIILAVAILGAIGIAQAKKPAPTSPLIPNTMMPATNANNTAASSNTATPTSYKDGTYTGDAADTPYGAVQISAVISGGKITDINFLQMPFEEGHSQEITNYAKPYLKQTAISKQNAKNIEFVTGATSTSYGFQESLQAALNQAATS